MSNQKYFQEHIDFIAENIIGCSYANLAKMFNEKFNFDIRPDRLAGLASKHGLRNFRELPKQTQFKKGNVPHNRRTIGSEIVWVDGILKVKVAEHGKWRGKHQIIWEKANGKIPKGHVVIFADKNPKNLELSNLILVSRAKLMVMNRKKLIFENTDLTKSGVIIADVHMKIREKKREGNVIK